METIGIIVVMRHNFNQENKVFATLADANKWADRNGFTLTSTESPTVYVAQF